MTLDFLYFLGLWVLGFSVLMSVALAFMMIGRALGFPL